MNRPNWVCMGCGMWSSRKYSVERHILNVHDGISTMVPFIEYIVGRQTGVIPPLRQAVQLAGPELKSQEPEKTGLLDTTAAEFWKGYAREMGREAARRKNQGSL